MPESSLTGARRVPQRLLYPAAFTAGAASLAWIGLGYLGQPFALAMTVLIAAGYLAGAWELRRFAQATAALDLALAALPAELATPAEWLDRLPPGLRQAVRLRLDGERVALPGPAMAPYLAGLLVLLGMLGTFLGMVATLNGTGAALDSATSVEAVRRTLAAPVRGLGLAFGTSVAGVAASAALGLMVALRRRERQRSGLALEAALGGGALRAFSASHRREASFQLLQRQADQLPALVERLQALGERLAQEAQATRSQLVEQQQAFHRQAELAYTGLAASVGRSLDEALRASLTESARLTGQTIEPVVRSTMAQIAHETAGLHQTLTQTAGQQLGALAGQFDATTAAVAQHWQAGLAEQAALQRALMAELAGQARSMTREAAGQLAEAAARLDARLDATRERVEHQATALLQAVQAANAAAQAHSQRQDAERLAGWQRALQDSAQALQQRWQQAGEQTLAQQRQICETLAQTARTITEQQEAQTRETLARIGGLLQASGEAPRQAAELVAEMRQRFSDSLAHDNAVLQERQRLLDTLGTLLDTVNRASHEQRQAIDALVASTAGVLERAGAQFAERTGAEAARLTEAAAQIGGSAVEVASLGEAFGTAVQRFGQSADQLVGQLGRLQDALAQAMGRSDEQLAYTVAQARELVELSVMSQKQVIDELQRLAGRQPALSEG